MRRRIGRENSQGRARREEVGISFFEKIFSL